MPHTSVETPVDRRLAFEPVLIALARDVAECAACLRYADWPSAWGRPATIPNAFVAYLVKSRSCWELT
jgi:hypothetical protein